jgi:hypothetical protein
VLVELTVLAVVFVVACFAAWRRGRLRARRREMKREVRKRWEKDFPGELCPECPVCRLPFPTSLFECPFCGRSRARARALRRDLDWKLSTRSGYGALDGILTEILEDLPPDR